MLLLLNSNGITVNFKKCLFSKDGLFFSKDGIKPDRSKLEETEKMHTPQNAKHLRSFLVFPNYVKGFIPNYSTLKYNHTSLKRIFTKESRFWLDWNL